MDFVPQSEEKSFQLVRGSSFQSDFLQNPYFNTIAFLANFFIIEYVLALESEHHVHVTVCQWLKKTIKDIHS